MDVKRTVFGIYYPETRRIVDQLWQERPHGWYERNYTGVQDRMHRGVSNGRGQRGHPCAARAARDARGRRIHEFQGFGVSL